MPIYSEKSNKHITLVMPDLLPGAMLNQDDGTMQKLPLPFFKKFFARANLRSCSAKYHEQLLLELFKYSLDTPTAAIAALGEGLPAIQGWWMYADPVQWQADMNHVYLRGPQYCQVTQAEANEIIAQLNQLLNPDGLNLYYGKQHWYLHMADDPQINNQSLFAVLDAELHDVLPTGPRAKYWRALITELQMLLHTHSVNAERKRNAQPLINSLWLWGEGQLPPASNVTWNGVWTDNNLVKGLAMLNQVMVEQLPIPWEQWLLEQPAGHYLIACDPDYAITDISTWYKMLYHFETTWIMPIFKALRTKQLASVTIYPGNQFGYELNQRNVRQWWKRGRIF